MSRILHKITPVFSEFPEISETTPNINRTFTAEEEYIKNAKKVFFLLANELR